MLTYNGQSMSEYVDELLGKCETAVREYEISYPRREYGDVYPCLSVVYDVISLKGDVMNIKVMLEPGAIAPTRAHENDAAIDLYAKHDAVIMPHAFGKVDTGVHFHIPVGYCGVIISRSGLNLKYGITSTGLIDPDYTGAVAVIMHNDGDSPYEVKAGQRVSQMMFQRYEKPTLELVSRLDDTERGTDGFGSTGL